MTRRIVVLLALLLVANGCGGDDSSDAGGEDVVASGIVVDSAGGSVVSSDGLFTVEIPPGALTEPTPIEVEPVEPETVDIDPTLLAGEVYRLLPAGTTFAVPVVTTRSVSAAALGVDDDVLPFFAVLQRNDGPWTPISNEARRDGDTILVNATIDHFSENAAIGFTALGVENAIRLELTPGEFTAPVGSSVETLLSAELHEGLNTFRNSFASSADGAIVSYEPMVDSFSAVLDSFSTVVASCGEEEGRGEYRLELAGLVSVDEPVNEPLDLVSEVFALLFGITPAPEPYTMSVVGQATCTGATAADDESGQAGDPEGATSLLAAIRGSFGGPLTLGDASSTFESPFLLSFLTPESAGAVLTELDQQTIADLERFLARQALLDLAQRLHDQAQRQALPDFPQSIPRQYARQPVILSQFQPDGTAQNTFGGAFDFGSNFIRTVMANATDTYGEVYVIDFSCTENNEAGLCSRLSVDRGVSLGGSPDINIECAVSDAFLSLGGEAATTCGQEYTWQLDLSGILALETGTGG